MAIGFEEGAQPQREIEEIIYKPDMQKVSSSTPASVVVTVKDISNVLTDVTATTMPTNTPSASGTVITLSPLLALVAKHRYRVDVQFVVDGNKVIEPLFVNAEE